MRLSFAQNTSMEHHSTQHLQNTHTGFLLVGIESVKDTGCITYKISVINYHTKRRCPTMEERQSIVQNGFRLGCGGGCSHVGINPAVQEMRCCKKNNYSGKIWISEFNSFLLSCNSKKNVTCSQSFTWCSNALKQAWNLIYITSLHNMLNLDYHTQQRHIFG